MIFDGYNFDGELKDGDVSLRFRYRPMLSAERREFLAAFRGWPDDVKVFEKSRWLQQHVLAMSPFESVKDVRQRPMLFARLHHVLVGMMPADNDKTWSSHWESNDTQNLRTGIRIAILHPFLDRRSCSSCLKWWYREDTGTIEQEDGKDALRPPEFPPMCRTNDGCVVGTPEHPLRLTARNRAAWSHFQRCEAMGIWPDDPIVARNVLVIRRARDDAWRERTAGYGSAGRGGSGDLAGSRRHAASGNNGTAGSPFFFAGEPPV